MTTVRTDHDTCAAFHHDPGELSAAFVWERSQRLLLSASPPVRFVIGGWSNLVDALERRVRSLGAEIVTGESVDALPAGPVVLALELTDTRRLLHDDTLTWLSGRTVCLDLGLREEHGDPWIVSDLASAGWAERYNAQDASLAPAAEQLVQAQMPIRPDESTDDAATRLEHMLDLSFDDWRARVTWRRRQVMDGRSGALDLPGTTWRERPEVTGAHEPEELDAIAKGLGRVATAPEDAAPITWRMRQIVLTR